MRIAFFTEAYAPYQSGVTISIDTFARDLVRLGHQIRVYAPAYPGYKDLNENPSSFRFVSIPLGYPGFRLAIPNPLSLAKDIKAFNPEVIHAHHPFRLGALAKKWSQKLNVPLFYTFHTLFTEYLRLVPFGDNKLLYTLVTKAVRNFCESCTTVIVPTEQARQHLIDVYQPHCDLAIIPTGIDLAKFPKQEIRHSPVKSKLIHVGRLSYEKNINFLLQVLLKLPKQIGLTIVGDGPAKQDLEHKSQVLGLSERVSFIGFKPRAELFGYFKQADIFVTASKSETQGLVFMEAKVAGLPTVAIKAAGAQNMVIDGSDGYLVGDDIAVFAEMITKLYADEVLYSNFSRAALANLDNFSSTKTAQRLVELYEDKRG